MTNRIRLYLLLILVLLLAAILIIYQYMKDLYAPVPDPVLIPVSDEDRIRTKESFQASKASSVTQSPKHDVNTDTKIGMATDMYNNIIFPVERDALDDSFIFSRFSVSELSQELIRRIRNVSYPDNCPLPLSDLRYLSVLHIGFDGLVHSGELIVNKSIADDVLDIFRSLFDAAYPIESVRLIEDFNGDDVSSMSANNTSAFNYRYIAGTNTLSNHAYGLAIDINPLYNPYITYDSDGSVNISPSNASAYADRSSSNPYYIDSQDLCYRLFTEHGFFWGGTWTDSVDYQHFYKEPL